MNKSEQRTNNRLENLTKIINEKFDEQGSSDLSTKAIEFNHYVMDMYKVSRVLKNRIELMHLFNDEIIYPVYVDEGIRSYLKKNDTFLLGLGLKDFDWHVLYMSPPYYDFAVSSES